MKISQKIAHLSTQGGLKDGFGIEKLKQKSETNCLRHSNFKRY